MGEMGTEEKHIKQQSVADVRREGQITQGGLWGGVGETRGLGGGQWRQTRPVSWAVGSAGWYIPSSKRLAAAIPETGEGLLLGVGSFVPLNMLNTPKAFATVLARQRLGFGLGDLAGRGGSEGGRVRRRPLHGRNGEHSDGERRRREEVREAQSMAAQNLAREWGS
jgi:hypothetical protein